MTNCEARGASGPNHVPVMFSVVESEAAISPTLGGGNARSLTSYEIAKRLAYGMSGHGTRLVRARPPRRDSTEIPASRTIVDASTALGQRPPARAGHYATKPTVDRGYECRASNSPHPPPIAKTTDGLITYPTASRTCADSFSSCCCSSRSGRFCGSSSRHMYRRTMEAYALTVTR